LPDARRSIHWIDVAQGEHQSVHDAPQRLSLRLAEPLAGGADGSNCAVLYFHGFGSDQLGEKADFFRSRALAAGLAFCSFDFRGHGRSEGDLRELTLSRNLADALAVREFLTARGYAKVVLLGSSMGGLTALWHGARQPEGVVAGCFIAPALTFADSFLQFLSPEEARQWKRQGVFRFDDGERSCELGWELIENFRQFDRHLLARIYRIPSLILQGKLDNRVSWRMVRDFVAEAASGAFQLRLFEDGDHRLADRKELLWAEIVNHLGLLGLL